MENSTDSYLSVAGESRGVYREKASKFIAIALPVASEEEVKSSLDRIRKEYHDANHHCYAYRLGPEGTLYRANDDGEPSGSAGKPIYGQILSMGLSDVLVAVVRYFGGTKLGVPGLIHAYKVSTREALEQSTIVEKTVRVSFRIIFDYPVMNEVMRILKEEGVRITGQSSTDRCGIDFDVRKSNIQIIENRFSRLRGVIYSRL